MFWMKNVIIYIKAPFCFDFCNMKIPNWNTRTLKIWLNCWSLIIDLILSLSRCSKCILLVVAKFRSSMFKIKNAHSQLYVHSRIITEVSA